MLFLNPTGDFSWFFIVRVAVDGGGSRLGCIGGTPISSLVG